MEKDTTEEDISPKKSDDEEKDDDPPSGGAAALGDVGSGENGPGGQKPAEKHQESSQSQVNTS